MINETSKEMIKKDKLNTESHNTEKSDVDKIISSMRLEDKVAYGSGKDFWHTKDMPCYAIESLMMADGPHGLRKQEVSNDMLGINKSVPATSFPTAVITACSWDEDLIYKEGEAIAKEALANGVGVVLGPGANIKRNPLCGRNFEYYSEDPYLTGKLAAAFINGAQSTGAGTSLKHFAFNNQEYKRFSSDSIVDERAMREIYLAGFETAVKEAKPATVMCAYNLVNGEYCSDNKKLLTDILRDEWGFDGVVVTDWGAMNNRIKAYEAGCDLSMPGGSSYMEKETVKAVREGILDEKYVDNSVRRTYKLVENGLKAIRDASKNYGGVNLLDHYELACHIATESAVLLKNADKILPLSESAGVAFVGNMAKEPRYQGAGSSHINPWKLDSVLEICPEIPWVQGCKFDGSTTDELLNEAKEVAKVAKTVVVFAGLTDNYESEGYDRDNMKMPQGHVDMIEAVASVNDNVIVVLMSGSAVEVPWIDKVKGLLYMGLPGEAGGLAIKKLLFGEVAPSGRLAETWPLEYKDCVCSDYYGGIKTAEYRESVYVGYRYYETVGKRVRFPFGYGLTYNEYEYSNLNINENTVSVTVTNKGESTGKEVVQLYVECVGDGEETCVYRPRRELKAFKKIELAKGESKVVSFELNDRSFAIWNDGWKVVPGKYVLSVGINSHDMVLSKEIEIEGSKCETSSNTEIPTWYHTLEGIPTREDFEKLIGRKIVIKELKKGEFTMKNTVLEMKDYSLAMKLLYKIIEIVVSKGFDGKKDYNNPTYRMMISSAADCSLTGIKIVNSMNNGLLEGLLEMANGHYFKGIIRMFKKN